MSTIAMTVPGTHQDVIGFDVSMQDASSLHQLQRQKHLQDTTQLLQARLVHHLVVTDDLDGHFLVPLQGVASGFSLEESETRAVDGF